MSVAHTLPVVILGADSPNALGILRSLQKADICAIGVFCNSRSSVSRRSRHWQSKVDVSSRSELASSLATLARPGVKLPVFCATDEELLWVDDHRETLSASFILPEAKGRRLRDILPKDAILQLGTGAGFSVPKTLKPSEFLDGQAIQFPVMVKALTSDLTGDTGFHRFDTAPALRAWLERTGFGDRQVVLQEYLHPKDYKSYEIQTCILGGEAVMLGVHEKMHATPRCVDGPPIATCMLRRVQGERFLAPMLKLTRDAGLNGPVNTELLVGPRGIFFLESNLRFSLNTPLDTVAGVNLPALVYHEWLGLPPKDLSLQGDHRSAMLYEHASVLYMLRFAGNKRWRFLQDALKSNKRLYFEWDDPMPFVQMIMELGPMRALESLRGRVVQTARS